MAWNDSLLNPNTSRGLINAYGNQEASRLGVGAFGGAIENFLDRYRQGKQDRRSENKDVQDQRIQNADLMTKGLIQETPESEYTYTPEALAERKFKSQSAIDELALKKAKEAREEESTRTTGLMGQAKEGLIPVADETGKITGYKQDDLTAAKRALENRKLEADTRKLNAEASEKSSIKPLDARMQKLNASDKVRFDNATMMLKNIKDMDSALAGGSNTFSLKGDNPYTIAARNAAEAYGRMQSGGAINKDEEARFNAASPGMRDNREVQALKLQKQRDVAIDRLKTLGFTPEELGIDTGLSYGQRNGAPSPQAGASGPRVGQVEDGHKFLGGNPADPSSWQAVR